MSALFCTLRLASAQSLDLVPEWRNWKQEALERAHVRILNHLCAELTAQVAEDSIVDLDLSKSAFFYPFIKLCSTHTSSAATKEPLEIEQSVKAVIQLCATFSKHRNSLQAQLLKTVDQFYQAGGKKNQHPEDDGLRAMLNDLKLKQCIDNFMSTEYISLLLALVVRSSEEKLAPLHVQYEANEVLASLFRFSNRFMFYERPAKAVSTVVDDGLDLDEDENDGDMVIVGGEMLSTVVANEASRAAFVQAFNADTSQLIGFLSSSCYYARQACLQALAVLINEK
jgi:hypothetical protein